MEVRELVLACFGRVFCGLDAEEAVAVARKAIEVAGKDADAVDLLDAFDDVWAASLTAGTIHEELTMPTHPLDELTRMLNVAASQEERDFLMEEYGGHVHDHPRPKRYRDKSLVAIKSARQKKRRPWDKHGD